jgi:prevent-host-death family protein
MKVATSTKIEVGVRDLKNNLSRYLDRISRGEEIVVTDRGRPVARLTAVDAPTHRLAALVASGAVQPPSDRSRHRPARRVTATGSVSGLVADQRR